MSITRSVGVSLLVALAAGCVEPANRSTRAIIGGAPDDTRPWVVAVINWDRASGGGLCTGTLVAEDVVITAKHCAWHRLPDDSYAATASDRMEVRVGPHAVDEIRQTRRVVEIISPPGDYSPSRIRAGEDIALLRLDAPVSGAAPRELATSAPVVGDTATIVGYGFIDAVAPDVGRRYAGDTEVVEVETHLARTLGDTWTCQGDSGGPLFIDGRVAGVTSAGLGGCVRDAQHLYTIVAPHLDWIRAVVPPLCEPLPETCDMSDEDCDGLVDEGVCAADGGISDGGAAPPPASGCSVAMRSGGLPWFGASVLAWLLWRRRS